jgi:UDP-N-acetylglucosamine 2-epimerase (non-hydrolysing)
MTNKTIKIISVVGTRPNFMKIAPIIHEIEKHPDIEHILVHTGQHYDSKMSGNFFKDLGIPEPDFNLNIGSDTQSKQVAKIMIAFEGVCDEVKPDGLIVVGDVNSTMAATLVAAKKGITSFHVEAGIRSRDREMPEEINRLVTDAICDYLLPPSTDAMQNLIKEGHDPSHIELVGNIMIDTLQKNQPQIQNSKILEALNLEPKNYAVLTLHRPSNVDHKETFKAILEAIAFTQEYLPVLYPIHPRSKKMLEQFGLMDYVNSLPQLYLVDALGYNDFGKLVSKAKMVLTDSGGIQEETTVYKVPCITIRENTERPITIWEGTNELAGKSKDKIINLVGKVLNGQWKDSKIPQLWDGKTASRIVSLVKQKL